MEPVKENSFEQFKNLLDFAFNNKHSSFYRDKYRKAGFAPDTDFRSLEDVKKIPFSSKEELIKENPSRLLFVPEQEVEVVATTSGTTTQKPLIVFYAKEHLGLSPDWWDVRMREKKVLILMHSSRIPMVNLSFREAKLTLAGDVYNLPASCLLASRLGVNHVHTTPTLALMLKKHLAEYRELENNLQSFSVGGEMVGEGKRKLLRESYPGKEIFINYGMSEIGGCPALQCRHLARREGKPLFHCRVDDCYFEIIDPETKEDVPFGEEGELVLTSFRSKATPLVRYLTGDAASFRENDCPCGAPGPFLEVHGRINYDIIRVGGFELRSDMLEKAITSLGSYIKDSFEAHIYEKFAGNKPKIRIVLNLSLRDDVKESPAIRKKVEEEFLENWQISPRANLKKAVEAGLFEFPQINFVSINLPASGKTRRVLVLH
jgi:phenylacetate-CoA ligase